MESLLYKLYSNNYFGIGLLMVIAILAFLFLIILFFGKKDEKKRNKKVIEENKTEIAEKPVIEETKIEEKETEQTLEPISLTEEVNDVPSLEEPVVLEPIAEEDNKTLPEEPVVFTETPREELDDFVTSNLVLNTDYINENIETPIEELKDETPELPERDSDIYNLNSIINEELSVNEPALEDVLNKYDVAEDIDEEQEYTFNPIIEEEKSIVTESEEPLKKSSTPTPFSSVYLTKEEAKPQQEESVVEEPVEEEVRPITPTRPTFDLPKRVDLPKKNTMASEGMINTSRLENHASNIFDNLNEETYTIDK